MRSPGEEEEEDRDVPPLRAEQGEGRAKLGPLPGMASRSGEEERASEASEGQAVSPATLAAQAAAPEQRFLQAAAGARLEPVSAAIPQAAAAEPATAEAGAAAAGHFRETAAEAEAEAIWEASS